MLKMVCKILCRIILYDQVDQLRLTDQIKTNLQFKMWEAAKINIENHLHKLGFVSCFHVWFPYKLSNKKIKITGLYVYAQFTT